MYLRDRDGVLEFGNNFGATAGLKLACYRSICFGNNVLIGWNTQILDTDFHVLKPLDNSTPRSKGFGAIVIGHDVWIANGCKIYKNVSIPPLCVVGADTILHKSIKADPYSLITNKIEPAVRVTGAYYDRKEDKIKYKTNEA